MSDLEAGNGRWERVIDPKLSWENERLHTCEPPVLTPEMAVGHGSLWGCACGRRFRVNRRGDAISWVIGT